MDQNDEQASTPIRDITEYRKLVGKLLYLTNTKPDIAFVVKKLAQNLEKPSEKHMTAAHRVL